MLREHLYYLQSLGQKDMPVENMLAVDRHMSQRNCWMHFLGNLRDVITHL